MDHHKRPSGCHGENSWYDNVVMMVSDDSDADDCSDGDDRGLCDGKDVMLVVLMTVMVVVTLQAIMMLVMTYFFLGADANAFNTATKQAKEGCPISRLLNTNITLDAKLSK